MKSTTRILSSIVIVLSVSSCSGMVQTFDEWGEAMPTYNDSWCEGWFCWNSTTTKEKALRGSGSQPVYSPGQNSQGYQQGSAAPSNPYGEPNPYGVKQPPPPQGAYGQPSAPSNPYAKAPPPLPTPQGAQYGGLPPSPDGNNNDLKFGEGGLPQFPAEFRNDFPSQDAPPQRGFVPPPLAGTPPPPPPQRGSPPDWNRQAQKLPPGPDGDLPPGYDPSTGLPPGAVPGVNWPPPRPEDEEWDDGPYNLGLDNSILN